MNHKLNTDIFSTVDLCLATTLSLSYPIEEIDRSNPKQGVFIFKQSPELKKLIEQYFRNEIKVSPQSFFNQLRAVKSRLFINSRLW